MNRGDLKACSWYAKKVVVATRKRGKADVRVSAACIAVEGDAEATT